jgi:Methyltransferase domain
MNPLRDFFENHEHRLIHKWDHYFDIYDRHLSRFKGTCPVILEIGVAHGGSLQMWNHYFERRCHIYAVDINPACKQFEEPNIRIFTGDQGDSVFMKRLRYEILLRERRIDLVIDDGGHTMKQQKTSINMLYPSISKNGMYICEDLHTSYWKEYGGGLGPINGRRSFITYAKHLIDYLNASHIRGAKSDPFTLSTDSLHFYDSMLVIEKKEREKPFDVKKGTPAIFDPLVDKFVVNNWTLLS